MNVLHCFYIFQNISVEDALENSDFIAPWVASIIDALSNEPGFKVGLCFPINSKNIERFEKNSILYYGVPCAIALKSYINRIILKFKPEISDEDIFLPFVIESVITDFKPDIIHIWGSENSFGKLLQLTKIPCIIHIQGILNPCGNKWYQFLSEYDIVRYSNLFKLLKRGGGMIREHNIFKKRMLREYDILRNAKYLMGRTIWDRRVLLLLAPKIAYYHIEELLRPEFYYNEWTINNGMDSIFSILTMTRDATYKGLETIFKINHLLKNNTQLNFCIKVIGMREDSEIISILKKKMQTKWPELISNIVFTGKLNTKEIIAEMQSANIFLQTSRIENSPNSICEAMMLGMPVIATNVGGTPSLIEDGIDGILVQEDEPYSICGAILELVNSPGKAKDIGANARKRQLIRHNKTTIVNSLVKTYTEIILQHKTNSFSY